MNQTVPIIDISKVEHSSKIDFFDDDFVIFDDLNEIPLFDYPSRIADAAVFAIYYLAADLFDNIYNFTVALQAAGR